MRILPAAGRLQPFDLTERGAKLEAYAECFAPALPRNVAERELEHVGAALGWTGEQLRTASVRQNEGPGNALLAMLVYEQLAEVFTQFGEKGVSAEKVANNLVRDLRRYQVNDAALGPHLADQWALPLALAVCQRRQPASYSATELTAHATTNFETIATFLPVRFSVAPRGQGWLVECSRA